MNSGHNGFIEGELRLVIVDSPDAAAPLISALDAAAIGAWMWVEAEGSLYFSPGVLTLLGLELEPRSDLLRRFLRSVHEEDQPLVARLLRCEMPAGPFALRYRFAPPGGPLRWIEERGRVERDASGALIRQGGTMRDVTWEVGREQEQREAEARLEALINAMPFSVWGRSGPNLVLTHQNAHAIALCGDSRGRPLSHEPAETRELWEPRLAQVLTGQVVRTRQSYVRDGHERVLDEIIAPVVVENEVTGVVGIGIDVTEEERTRRFEALLTEISAGFASLSTDMLDAALVEALGRFGRFLRAPVATLAELEEGRRVRLTHCWADPASGFTPPEAIDVDAALLAPLLDRLADNEGLLVRSCDDLPAGSAVRRWLEQHGSRSVAVVPMREADGPLALFALAGLPDQPVDWPADTLPLMRIASALLSGVLARIRAERRQRQIERQILDAEKLESLGALAGGIAHDFNNLLTAILGNATLMHAEVGEHSPLSRSLQQVEDAALRAAELCRQLLEYAGRGRFTLQPLDVNEVVRGTEALMRVTVPKKVSLVVTLQPGLPQVLADQKQIRQLLMNLLLNAAEALGDRPGEIAITTSAAHHTARALATASVRSPDLRDGEYVSLRITDTGEGMSEETLARIFDPFFSTRFIGRGLGLSAVVGIVRAHKGALRVESRLGAGTSFELLLPACGDALPPTESKARDLSETFPPSTAPAVRTALVIDDEAGVRELVGHVLERAGFATIRAADGTQGLEAFRQHANTVHIVVVDLIMPGLDGHEILTAMREVRPDLPAVIMSGFTPGTLHDSPHQIFLQKPFTPAALRAAVRRALGEERDSRE